MLALWVPPGSAKLLQRTGTSPTVSNGHQESRNTHKRRPNFNFNNYEKRCLKLDFPCYKEEKCLARGTNRFLIEGPQLPVVSSLCNAMSPGGLAYIGAACIRIATGNYFPPLLYKPLSLTWFCNPPHTFAFILMFV